MPVKLPLPETALPDAETVISPPILSTLFVTSIVQSLAGDDPPRSLPRITISSPTA